MRKLISLLTAIAITIIPSLSSAEEFNLAKAVNNEEKSLLMMQIVDKTQDEPLQFQLWVTPLKGGDDYDVGYGEFIIQGDKVLHYNIDTEELSEEDFNIKLSSSIPLSGGEEAIYKSNLDGGLKAYKDKKKPLLSQMYNTMSLSSLMMAFGNEASVESDLDEMMNMDASMEISHTLMANEFKKAGIKLNPFIKPTKGHTSVSIKDKTLIINIKYQDDDKNSLYEVNMFWRDPGSD